MPVLGGGNWDRLSNGCFITHEIMEGRMREKSLQVMAACEWITVVHNSSLCQIVSGS